MTVGVTLGDTSAVVVANWVVVHDVLVVTAWETAADGIGERALASWVWLVVTLGEEQVNVLAERGGSRGSSSTGRGWWRPVVDPRNDDTVDRGCDVVASGGGCSGGSWGCGGSLNRVDDRRRDAGGSSLA